MLKHKAFLEQAIADLNTAISIPPENRGSTFCMLLQMAFEKLAKSALLQSGQKVKNNHCIVGIFLGFLRRKKNPITTDAKVRDFILHLENLHPSLAMDTREQLEYPWEIPQNDFLPPEKNLSILLSIQNPKDTTILKSINFAHFIAKTIKRNLFVQKGIRPI